MKLSSMLLISAVLFTGATWAGGNDAVKSALSAQQGKRVTVHLQSGGDLTGTVQTVSDDSVKLAELSGKEFYDAVVRLDRIDAVVVRARDK